MGGHRFSGLAAALTLAGALGSTPVALGQSNTNNGNTPQGRPFQYIQGQISILQQQVAAVQTQVNGIEQRLQQQINDILSRIATIEGRVGSLQDRVQSVEEATALLQNRIGANEQSILALRDAVSALESQLDVLQGQVAQNSDDIAILDAHIGSVRDLIHAHELRISSLEDESVRILDFLATMVNSSCVAGTAVRAVSSNGMLLCTSVGGGGGASGTLRTARHTVLFGVPAGVGTFMEVSCANSADVLASGGYSRVSAPEFEHSVCRGRRLDV